MSGSLVLAFASVSIQWVSAAVVLFGWTAETSQTPFKSAIPKKGEIVTYRDDKLFGLKWKDKRVVSMLSTIHYDTMISKECRNQQTPGGVETIRKPLIIKDYNQYMGGVDKSDQLVVYYGLRRSSKKWWKRVFLHLMELTMVNTYILYCYNTPKKERITHLKFRLDVAKALLEAVHPVPALRYQPPPDAANVVLRLTGCHFPEPAGGRPDCKVCSDRAAGKRKHSAAV